jgi:hypothetical protein
VDDDVQQCCQHWLVLMWLTQEGCTLLLLLLLLLVESGPVHELLLHPAAAPIVLGLLHLQQQVLLLLQH